MATEKLTTFVFPSRLLAAEHPCSVSSSGGKRTLGNALRLRSALLRPGALVIELAELPLGAEAAQMGIHVFVPLSDECPPQFFCRSALRREFECSPDDVLFHWPVPNLVK